ncbi:hypothetical protein HYH02_003152 [Chlamydomonas schloesseri]|uniref:Uncharacterized protein n=1 Tax=Chlamydomonas schloesseri TaxID=2026947 RepID=A0A835WRJ3_9CHLO|nr:hypothetical protein HYH02_003152 [Chlamydomonas schloesseri]|eukprot:KAG2452119.1 hypothetical protein HYH02_003152 [Chlamydomonas schloesseri]
MEEGEKLQKELNDIGAEIARVSAQAESAKDAEDKRYFREKELMLRKEKLMLLEARGAAAGPGPGSTAADGSRPAAAASSLACPPACKLRLRQDVLNTDLYFFEPMDTSSAAASAASPGVSSGSFFLDPEGKQKAELEDWLGLAMDLHGKGKPILPLIINGQVKSGKSYMLNEVLPAVANTYYCSASAASAASDSAANASAASVSAASDSTASDSVSAASDSAASDSDSDSQQQQAGGGGAMQQLSGPPNFLRVNCLDCDRSSGVGGFLKELLVKLKRSAADERLYAAASTPVPSDCSAGTMADAIQDFMRRLPRDRLNFLLVDEAQSFYLMARPAVFGDGAPRDPTLDVEAVLHMRRILKGLLLDSPHWVAWAVTGSSMATLWANVAATPTNGFSLIMHHRRLNLSPTMPLEALQVAWAQLKAQAKTWHPVRPLPKDLAWQSPPQVAMLAYLCEEWRYSRTAGTAAELVEQTMTQKLIPEVLADLRMVLQVLGQPASQLLLLRELLDPAAGVEAAKLPPAFKVLLGSFATTRDDGTLFLDYPLLAQVLQAVTTESGELLEAITAVQSISSKMFRELVVLGECCKSRSFDSLEDLHGLLREMETALALKPDTLLGTDWFTQALDHRCNSRGGKANFEKTHRAQATEDAKVGLRWFHALLRNVLCHGYISEQRQALQAYPPQLAALHSSGRVGKELTKTFDSPPPTRSKAPVASAAAAPRSAAAPRAQLQPPGAGPAVRPIVSLHLGKRLGRAAGAAVIPRRYVA